MSNPIRLSIRALLSCAFLPALLAVAAPAFAVRALPANDCLPVCNSSCVKPLSIPDRWDDVTSIPGHDAWRGNGTYDSESFTDSNDNQLYDVGEAFTDEDGNGHLDAEAYHPLLTGYIPDPYPGNELSPAGDFGLELTLKESSADRTQSSHYFAVAFPAINRGTPDRGASAFRRNLAECSSYMTFAHDRLVLETGNMAGPAVAAATDLIASDPDARYDPVTRDVVGTRSPDGESPRLVLVPLHDPRLVVKPGRRQVQVTKLVAFFVSGVGDNGEIKGVLLKIQSPGTPCACCGDLAANWLRSCP